MKAFTAGIDAGGTTFKLAVAAKNGDGDEVLATGRVPTTTPETTLRAASDALAAMAAAAGGRIVRLGVGSFGPIDIDPASDGYGTILGTPKAGWEGARVLGTLMELLGVPGSPIPGALDTDVNAALAAERRWGAAQGTDSAAYVTVGTGIGVGVYARGGFAGAPTHLELGHVRPPRHPADAGFDGLCALHGDCLEGLAAAPALVRRFGPLEPLAEDDAAWDVPAHYLAHLCVVIALGHRVQRIVLGGGVMNAGGLLGRVRERYGALMAGYLPEAPDALIVGAGLGDEAGVRGALVVAERAIDPGGRPAYGEPVGA